MHVTVPFLQRPHSLQPLERQPRLDARPSLLQPPHRLLALPPLLLLRRHHVGRVPDAVHHRRHEGRARTAAFGLGVTGTPLNLTVRWPGPTWRTQVIDDGAALEAAIGSMERPLVVVEPA